MNFVLVEETTPKAASPAPVATPDVRRVRRVNEAVSAISSNKPIAPTAVRSDRRWALRKRTDMPGFIAHNRNPQGTRCIVRNTSSSGALVEVLSGSDRFANPADDIPDRLTLVFISYKERTEVACAVMRRSGRQLGVRYVGPFRTFPAPQGSGKIQPTKKR